MRGKGGAQPLSAKPKAAREARGARPPGGLRPDPRGFCGLAEMQGRFTRSLQGPAKTGNRLFNEPISRAETMPPYKV